MNALTNYFKEAIIELKKVVWPTKKQTQNYSLIVIAMSLGMALFFGILDFILRQGVSAII